MSEPIPIGTRALCFDGKQYTVTQFDGHTYILQLDNSRHELKTTGDALKKFYLCWKP